MSTSKHGVDSDHHCNRCGEYVETDALSLEPHECPPGFKSPAPSDLGPPPAMSKEEMNAAFERMDRDVQRDLARPVVSPDPGPPVSEEEIPGLRALYKSAPFAIPIVNALQDRVCQARADVELLRRERDEAVAATARECVSIADYAKNNHEASEYSCSASRRVTAAERYAAKAQACNGIADRIRDRFSLPPSAPAGIERRRREGGVGR